MASTMTQLCQTSDSPSMVKPPSGDSEPREAWERYDDEVAVADREVGRLLASLPSPLDNQAVAFHRRSVSGSLIGSIKETQEVIDFCAEHGIAPDIEIIPIQDINGAMKKVEKGDVRFRYVIDMASLKQELEAF